MNQQIRFCTSFDGTRIAYAISGKGPLLVRAPHWFTHLEQDWTNPAMCPWVGLSRHYTLLRFDQRGTGLSDRQVCEVSFDAWMRDFEHVVDAAGWERFAILGLSQGAASAITYAARHPERVTHLVLCGGFARGWERRGLGPLELERQRMAFKLIEYGWGSGDPSFRQVFTTQFMPDADLASIHAFNAAMPLCSAAAIAAKTAETNSLIDVQHEAARVKCPALVFHAREDQRVPFEEGRLIAGLVPGARFVSLATRNHLMIESDPAWGDFVAETLAFYPDPGLARPAAFADLTARERDVLDLLAQGLDNAQIAARLALSEKTVRNNITHIFFKMQVESRAQAIVRSRAAGFGAGRPAG